jgi:hypothetical protein
MTLEQMLMVSLLIALLGCALYAWITRVDRTRPKFPEYVQTDYATAYKRRVAHNGYKSRMGAR